MKTFIYALCELLGHVPIIRYIGKTNDLKYRLKQHKTVSINAKTHLGNWLRFLRDRGEEPHIITLCEVDPDRGSAAEMLYIRLARDGGMELVNSTDGGEGCRNLSTEAREKIRASRVGKKASPELRARLSATRTGKNNHFFGKRHSLETRAKISASRSGKNNPMFGKHKSPETRAKISAALTGKQRSKEHCLAISISKSRKSKIPIESSEKTN